MEDSTTSRFNSKISIGEPEEQSPIHFSSAVTAAGVPKPREAPESVDLGSDDSACTVEGSGGELVVAQARAAGVEYVFANPGSFESGLFDALTDLSAMHVILGLHEGIVLSMADGYHRVTGKPGFVNVHAVVGTAQMMGQLYNANWDGSALVVTAGLLDSETGSDEVVLAPPPGYSQKEIPRPFTKMCWEVREPGVLPLMVRRAFKEAVTNPPGPVYLAMKDSALESNTVRARVLPAERFLLGGGTRPAKASIEQAARMLVESKRPLLVVGDEVWKAGAQQELLALSEELGLAVADQATAQAEMVAKGLSMDSPFQAFHNFPTRHPHYLGNFRADSVWMKRGIDLMVCIGCRDFGDRAVLQTSDVPSGVRVIRIGLNTSAMGRNYPTNLALVGDVKAALVELLEDELSQIMAESLDPNAVIVCENFTASYKPFAFGFRDDEQMHVGTAAAGLGWGVGAATGAKLGAPDRQVVCFIGDGAVMYSAAGFWTQARYNIPVLTVVANNHNYQTVRFVYHGFQGKMAATGHYAGTFLGEPDIDFVALAESQGVKGEKVNNPRQFEPALQRGKAMNQEGKPYLIEVATARYGPGAESVWCDRVAVQPPATRKPL